MTEHTSREGARKLLLVGNPNVGKSVLFGLLTGRYVVVSNYPGTTVEVSSGVGKALGEDIEVIDTPGANSLSPNSEDERVARDVVLAPGEKTIMQVADAKNLRRALLLTAQLAELELPTVLALNLWDEAQDRGIEIDIAAVAAAVGTPVVATVATERRGFGTLVSSIKDASVPLFRPAYGPVLEAAIVEIEALISGIVERGVRGVAVTLLAGDRELATSVARTASPDFRDRLKEIRNGARSRLNESVAVTIQRRRAAHADRLIARAVRRVRGPELSAGPLRSVAFFLGCPILFYAVGWQLASVLLFGIADGAPRFAALGGTFSAVLTHCAGVASMLLYSVSAWRREYATGGTAASALARLSTHPLGGIPLLVFVLWMLYLVVGVLGAGISVDFLETSVFGKLRDDGQYGGLINGPLARFTAWVAGGDGLVYAFFFGESSGILSKGMTYAVAIVFPIVALFFLMFALMEDSGYLPRLALLADRAFKRVGLSGKAVLPMVLGLGCGTMATMTARILESPKQRFIAILLLAVAVPCSAQLGIIAAALSGISPAGVAVYVCVIIGVMLLVGWGASVVIKGEASDFLIEIPPFRLPSMKNVIVKTYFRVKWFMREAVPLFLIGTTCLFIGEQLGILHAAEWLAKPLVSGLLGLPVRATKGFILGFLRRDYGAVIIFDEFRQGRMGADQALVALVVITLFVPCLAHLFVCIKELGWRKALLMNAFVFAIAFGVGGIVRAFIALTGLQVAVPM